MPTVVKCPICGKEHSLEVVRTSNLEVLYRCRNTETCGFQGDGMHLYQHACRFETLEQAYYSLVSKGLINLSEEQLKAEISAYILEQTTRFNAVYRFWLECREKLREGRSGVDGVLAALNIRDARLSPHFVSMVGAATGYDLLDEFDVSVGQSYLHWVKKSETYLVIPMWSSWVDITGYAVISASGEYHYISRVKKSTEIGIGMLQNYRMFDPRVYLCDNPVHALQLTHKSNIDGQQVPVLYCDPESIGIGSLLTGEVVITNFLDDERYFRLAMQTRSCRMFMGEDYGSVQGVTSKAILDGIRSKSVSAPEAIVRHVLKLEEADRVAFALNLGLLSDDVTRVIAAAPPHAREQVAQLFADNQRPISISMGADIITSTQSGWESSKNGLINDCPFYIDQIIYDQSKSEGTAIGTIVTGGQTVEFNSPLAEIEKKTVAWLTTQVLAAGGEYPIVDSKYGRKLMSISLFFRRPRTIQAQTSLGWTANHDAYRLPRITVMKSHAEVAPVSTYDSLSGFNLTDTDFIDTQVLNDVCQDNSESAAFWALFACIVTNVMSPFHGLQRVGCAVIRKSEDKASEVILNAAKDELGLLAVDFSAGTRHKEGELAIMSNKSPLPLWIGPAWQHSSNFGKWLRNSDDHNTLASVDQQLASMLALSGGWLQLTLPSMKNPEIVYGKWRAVVSFISWLADSNNRSFVSGTVTSSSLADAVLSKIERWLYDIGLTASPAIRRAVKMIDCGSVDSSHSLGVKFINFIVDSVINGSLSQRDSTADDIKPATVVVDRGTGRVCIPYAAVAELEGRLSCKVPTRSEISRALKDLDAYVGAKMGDTPGYVVHEMIYNMHWSLRLVQSD